jgi:hypothetical protein
MSSDLNYQNNIIQSNLTARIIHNCVFCNRILSYTSENEQYNYSAWCDHQEFDIEYFKYNYYRIDEPSIIFIPLLNIKKCNDENSLLWKDKNNFISVDFYNRIIYNGYGNVILDNLDLGNSSLQYLISTTKVLKLFS